MVATTTGSQLGGGGGGGEVGRGCETLGAEDALDTMHLPPPSHLPLTSLSTHLSPLTELDSSRRPARGVRPVWLQLPLLATDLTASSH